MGTFTGKLNRGMEGDRERGGRGAVAPVVSTGIARHELPAESTAGAVWSAVDLLDEFTLASLLPFNNHIR